MKVGQTQLTVLKWMQENVWKCMNTTSLSLARKIAEDSVNGEGSIVQSIYKLIKNGMILKEPSNNRSKFYYNFSINYNNLYLPKDIIERAPTHIKDAIKAANEKLKSGEYKALDEYGAGIIKAGEPFVEEDGVLYPPSAEKLKLKEYLDNITDSFGKTELTIERPPEKKPAEETPTVAVEPVMQKSADGKTISINLTINLNL